MSFLNLFEEVSINLFFCLKILKISSGKKNNRYSFFPYMNTSSEVINLIMYENNIKIPPK